MEKIKTTLKEGWKRTSSLILVWVVIGIIFGFCYLYLPGELINSGGGRVTNIIDAIYFSFVTLLTIGYGDIIPIGIIRILVPLEGLLGWIIFGIMVYRIVSVKQDVILERISNLSNQQYISRLKNYLFISNTNLTRFINTHRTKRRISEQEVFELTIISTTLEANILDSLKFLERESPEDKFMSEEDLLVIVRAIDLCIANLINALGVISPAISKDNLELYRNIEKISGHLDKIYVASLLKTKDKKIDAIKTLNEKLKKFLILKG